MWPPQQKKQSSEASTYSSYKKSPGKVKSGPARGILIRFRLKRITFSGRNVDLNCDERTHFSLCMRQQIDIGLRYMEAEDEAVERFRSIAVQSASSVPPALPSGQAVWLLAREGQSFRRRYVIEICVWVLSSALCQKRTFMANETPRVTP